MGAVVWALLVLLVGGPTLDLMLFGLHDHIVATSEAGGDPGPAGGGRELAPRIDAQRSDSPPSAPAVLVHHCDLWTSQGVALAATEVPPPTEPAARVCDALTPPIASRPGSPFTPPRA